MEGEEQYNVVEKRKEILEFVGKEKRKREYVKRLEEMLDKLQTELLRERDKVEVVNRKLGNELQRVKKEEQAKEQEQRDKLSAQERKIRRYLEAGLYQKRDVFRLDTVKVSYVKNPNDRKRFNLVYRVDESTKVNQLRKDCCKYWGLDPDDCILKNAANMKVTDNLLVQNCFRQGEVARLSLEKKRRQNILVSEAELKDIQPKKNNTGALIDPRKEGRKGGNAEVLGNTGYDDELRKLPGLRASLRRPAPKQSEHVSGIHCCDIFVYLMILVLTLVVMSSRMSPGQGFWFVEGIRSTLVEPSMAGNPKFGQAAQGSPGFAAIRNQNDAWNWLEFLADHVFDETSFLRTNMMPVGFLRLREQSVQRPPDKNHTQECAIPDITRMLSPFAKCYTDLTPDTVNRDNNTDLQKAWCEKSLKPDGCLKARQKGGVSGSQHGIYFPWYPMNASVTAADSDFQNIIGDLATYSSQGFIVDYALNPDSPGVSVATQKQAYIEELKILRNAKWISPATRAVTISFTMYSPHLDNWMSCEFLLEFPPSGQLIPHSNLRIFKPTIYESEREIIYLWIDNARMVLFLYVLFILMPRGYIHKIMFRRAGALYFLSVGGLSDVGGLLAYGTQAYTMYWMYPFRDERTTKYVQKLKNVEILDNARYDYRGYVDSAPIAHGYEMIVVYDGFILFFCCVRLTTYLRLSHRIFLLWRTVGLAARNYAFVLGMYVPSFFTWVCIAHKLWGHDLKNFASMRSTLLTLLMAINGELDYDTMFDTNFGGFWTPTFMLLFYVIIGLTLMSSCVAITVDAFYTMWITGEVSIKGDMGTNPVYAWNTEKWMRFFFSSSATLIDSMAAEVDASKD
jgi:hypothetical protein